METSKPASVYTAGIPTLSKDDMYNWQVKIGDRFNNDGDTLSLTTSCSTQIQSSLRLINGVANTLMQGAEVLHSKNVSAFKDVDAANAQMGLDAKRINSLKDQLTETEQKLGQAEKERDTWVSRGRNLEKQLVKLRSTQPMSATVAPAASSDRVLSLEQEVQTLQRQLSATELERDQARAMPPAATGSAESVFRGQSVPHRCT